MAAYEYIAVDENGNKLSGTYDGVDSVAALRKDLAKMGNTLLKAKRRGSDRLRHTGIPQNEIVSFTYRLAGMCSAGLSIVGCLETLEKQTENRSLKAVLADIRQSVAAGSTLKNAFTRHRRIFSDFFLGMLDAGESGGKLAETLEASAIYLEKRADFRSKVRSAFAYPIIVGLMCLAVVGALVIFVVPTFSKMYRQMHVPLPGPTQALIDLSTMVRGYWWMSLFLALAVGLLLKLVRNNARLKAAWDAFKLDMPGLAKFNRMIVACSFVRTFAMLASVGVSVVRALEVASAVVNNAKVTEIAGRLQQSIQAGNAVADSLKNCDLFPPVIVQLAACGEEAGTLPQMLNKGADFLEKDIDRMLRAFLVKIEPALTLIMGLIVGFILMSVYLPMFDYMSHLK
jgi:type IV pilus assembly protein PilC